eukprot:6184910-Pleurochrysis_carterae.AAC.2
MQQPDIVAVGKVAVREYAVVGLAGGAYGTRCRNDGGCCNLHAAMPKHFTIHMSSNTILHEIWLDVH